MIGTAAVVLNDVCMMQLMLFLGLTGPVGPDAKTALHCCTHSQLRLRLSPSTFALASAAVTDEASPSFTCKKLHPGNGNRDLKTAKAPAAGYQLIH